ncbi:MAG: ricin-type beta-trefoil lectin domain protein, partial [Acidobacteria bacterium]|nr:ricin-type beta-trefoil lectin domain protein [Acidobacteriota bacterium]
YFLIYDKVPAGKVTAERPASSLARCTDICTGSGCTAFSFKDGRCQLRSGNTLEPGISPGQVSGLRKSTLVRGRKIRALYIVPPDQQPRPDAETAIAAILREVQKHYLVQLGVTFELAEKGLVTRASSPFRAEESPIPMATVTDLVLSLMPEAYLWSEDIVVTVSEGIKGAAGGSAGVAKMTGYFWNDSYERYQGNGLLNSPHLNVWSHELGHAFGLRHHLTTRESIEGIYDLDSQRTPGELKLSCVMNHKSPLNTLYDHPFLPGEKRFLTEPDYSDPNKHDVFRGPINGKKRPHPSYYLKNEKVLIRSRMEPETRCLTLPDEVRDGTDTYLGSCGTLGWAWEIRPDGHIRSTDDPGRCLDAEGPSYAPGTALQVWSCKADQPNQLWTIDKRAGTLKPQGSPEVCVQADRTGADGTARIHLAKCDGSTAQQWSLKRPSVLRSALGARAKCLDPGGRRTRLFDYHDLITQQWIFTSDGRIHSAGFFGKCLETEGGTYTKGTFLRVDECSSDESHQLWTLDRYLGVLRPLGAPGQCVDVRDGGYRNNQRIQLWPCNYTPAQRWLLY